MVKEKIHPFKEKQKKQPGSRELILYNDDYNTFDYVMKTLIEVCGHEPCQAEQCTLVAHFKGKCGVKQGAYDELKPIQVEMTNRKLTVSIN